MLPLLRTFDDIDEDLTPTGERTIYEIPEANLARFEREIEKLSRKSERMIGLPITPVVFSHEMVEVAGGIRKVYQVYLTAETPRIDGWTFVARLDHSNDTGNIIRQVPNTGVDIPAEYRTVGPRCDHCRVNRKRRDTYLLVNQDGQFQQVGSSCLKDFFGHDPLKVARLAEYLGYADEISRAARETDDKGVDDHRYLNLEGFLSYAAMSVRRSGWVSGKAAYEDDKLISTREAADTLRRRGEPLKAEDRLLAAEAAEWAQGFADAPRSDYEHNVAVIANAAYIEPRSRGLAASIVGVFWQKRQRETKPASIDTGRLDGLVRLLAEAKPKSPKIRLTFDSRPLVIAMAGPSSRNAGSVYLTDGGPFEDNTYYGRVDTNGVYHPSHALDEAGRNALAKVLKALSNNPAATASRYGHLTGRCCFCNIKLTDGRSTEVGYGETCAASFNLPWGK